jgi:hypothetical protein
MDSSPEQPTIRIIVKDSHKRQNPLDMKETVIWHTLDRLEGHTIIQSTALLTFDKIEMRLEGAVPHFLNAFKRLILKSFRAGHSRVWITANDENNAISKAKSSYNVSKRP